LNSSFKNKSRINVDVFVLFCSVFKVQMFVAFLEQLNHLIMFSTKLSTLIL
jgi:hypothetical protein